MRKREGGQRLSQAPPLTSFNANMPPLRRMPLPRSRSSPRFPSGSPSRSPSVFPSPPTRFIKLSGYMCMPGDRQYKEAAEATGTTSSQPCYWFREDRTASYGGFGTPARRGNRSIGLGRRPAMHDQRSATQVGPSRQQTRRRNAVGPRAATLSESSGSPLSDLSDAPLSPTNSFAFQDNWDGSPKESLSECEESEEESQADNEPAIGPRAAASSGVPSSPLSELSDAPLSPTNSFDFQDSWDGSPEESPVEGEESEKKSVVDDRPDNPNAGEVAG
jgi:hypothetical protein